MRNSSRVSRSRRGIFRLISVRSTPLEFSRSIAVARDITRLVINNMRHADNFVCDFVALIVPRNYASET